MRVLSPTSALVLAAVALFGHGSAAAAMPQSAANADANWTDTKPLTGRALPCDQGKIKTFECQNVELLSYLQKDSLGQSVGTDMWGWHDSTTGREFALLGGESTAFVEVTDPLNPKYLGILHPPKGSEQHAAQSVRVYQHYAYIGYEGTEAGIQIFDLAQLRDVKSPQEFKETVHYDSVGNTHTIAIDQETGFAYANGTNTCGGGLHMIDVRTPTKPIFVGCYSNPDEGGLMGGGYVHDALCTIYRGPDQRYKGRELCLNSSGSSVVIVDVTDKKNPKMISIARYPNVGYAHQGWFTEDQRYFFLDDEFDEKTIGHTRTIGFDLAKLDDPVVLVEFLNTTTSTDHNLFIRGRYMYQGNYGAGLRIIDVADPKNPKEVGYLTNIGEAWGTYPFFKNDVVGVPTGQGLFLVRLQKR
jgi:choice-of-anchor B domain-containing protein